MKKLEDETKGRKDEKVNELVDQESITEDPPRTGGGTGGPEKQK